MAYEYSRTIKQIHQLVEDGIAPGVSYAIFDGQHEISEVFGNAQVVPTIEQLQAGMQYDVASLTKVIGTTTVIMHMVQAGKLSVEDSVQAYLPEFGDSRVKIRHLLTHTSGIEGYIPNRDDLDATHLHQALLSLTVSKNFGQQVKYADIGLIYLGWIIEKFYQQPVQQVIETEVLGPLKMMDSSFSPLKENCVPTQMHPTRGLIRGVVHDPKAYTLGAHCGSAGLFSTLTDVVSFAHQMIDSNLNGLLTDSTRALLQVDQTPIVGFHGRTFGWRLLQDRNDQHNILYHTGYTGTWLTIDLATNQAFVFLSNRVHPNDNNSVYLPRRDQIISTYLDEKC